MVAKREEGSTAQLLNFSWWYYFLYILTGVFATYFRDKRPGFPAMPGLEFNYNSSVGGVLCACIVTFLTGWAITFKSRGTMKLGPFSLPREYVWLIPSGIFTGIIIPTTTFMYTIHGLNVMVAMTLMRASVIVVGRAVDEIQLRQGIRKKKVLWEENVAAFFGFATVFVVIFMAPPGGFQFLRHPEAMVNMAFYVGSYFGRIYIMNHYKLTVGPPNAKGFFAVEQAFAAMTLIVLVGFFVFSPTLLGWQDKRILVVARAASDPSLGAIIAGVPFGALAYFSVALLMFKGVSATFATVTNRSVSLLAGTTATLVFWFFWVGPFPQTHEWLSLVLVGIAIGFLAKADRRRKKLESIPAGVTA